MKEKKLITKPILVTGTQRSGSTWVGAMLDYSPKIYLHTEPFSPLNTWDGLNVFVKDWFHLVTEEEGVKYKDELLFALGAGYTMKNLVNKLRSDSISLRGKLGAVKDYVVFPVKQAMDHRPLIKDPMAFFSSEWIYKNLNADIIILIRHPAAFVSSIKRMNQSIPGWGLDFFQDLIKQKELVDKYLRPFIEQLNQFASKKVKDIDIVEGSILLWNIFHHVVLDYQKQYGNVWHFYRHKDLSLDPVKYFGEIYRKLGLEFSDTIKSKIIQSTGEENPAESINNALHTLKRNSKENVLNWKKRLSPEEIDKIYEGTLKISSHFYREDEW